MHTHIIYIYTLIYAYTYVCVYVCLSTCIHTYVCMYAHMCLYILYTYIYVYIYVYNICAYTRRTCCSNHSGQNMNSQDWRHQARLMYLGDLEEKDEDDMKKLWQQWKSQDCLASAVRHFKKDVTVFGKLGSISWMSLQEEPYYLRSLLGPPDSWKFPYTK